jgi:hypothetical protein
MSAAAPFEFWVNKKGTATLLAYVEGNSGTPITQASITSISYTISQVDENEPDDDATTVTGHIDAAITVASAVFDTEQKTDVRWDPADHDGKGFNFEYTPVISTNQAFNNRGVRYRIRVKFTPVTGQVFWAEYLASAR